MKKNIKLNATRKGPVGEIQILGIQLDSGLKWTKHTDKIIKKLKMQKLVFIKLIAFI